jgi:DNA-nicking Smr family endonuclease
LIDDISDKDKKDWEEFLSNNETLPNKDITSLKKKDYKTISLDLHGYSLDEANVVVEKIITQSYENGISKLIIVTGKGLHSQNDKDPYVSKTLGILKHSVPEFIRNNTHLMKKIINISDAKIEDGGSGAFYVYLKKSIK